MARTTKSRKAPALDAAALRRRRDRASPPAPSPLALRSLRAPPKLREALCQRCATYALSRDDEDACDMQDDKKCSRCAKAHKPCKPIPVKFVPVFNQIIRDWDETDDDDEDGIAALRLRLADANKTMRLHQRKLEVADGTSKLSSRRGAGASLGQPELRRIATALENMVDSYRAVNGLEPLAEAVVEDEEEEEDEDEDEDEDV